MALGEVGSRRNAKTSFRARAVSPRFEFDSSEQLQSGNKPGPESTEAGMSNKMAEFKDEICAKHLVSIETRVNKIWPNQQPKITLLIRTPWLPDGGILITNDSVDEIAAEIARLGTKEAHR
jgi:hypothetical protein